MDVVFKHQHISVFADLKLNYMFMIFICTLPVSVLCMGSLFPWHENLQWARNIVLLHKCQGDVLAFRVSWEAGFQGQNTGH